MCTVHLEHDATAGAHYDAAPWRPFPTRERPRERKADEGQQQPIVSHFDLPCSQRRSSLCVARRSKAWARPGSPVLLSDYEMSRKGAEKRARERLYRGACASREPSRPSSGKGVPVCAASRVAFPRAGNSRESAVREPTRACFSSWCSVLLYACLKKQIGINASA